MNFQETVIKITPTFQLRLSKSRQIIFSLLLLVTYTSNLFSETTVNSFQFKSVFLSNAFTQKTVRAIVEDKTGFLWIGSEEGLIRYDGINAKPFRNNPDIEDSLADNVISQLLVDDSNHLWVGTIGNGLSVFEPSTETFHAIDSTITGNYVQALALNNTGDILLGASKGVFLISADDFSIMPLLNLKQLHNASNVVGLWQAPNKDLWIATDHGYLFRYADSALVQVGKRLADEFSKLFYSADYGLLIAAKKQGLLQLSDVNGGVSIDAKSLSVEPLFANILKQTTVYDVATSANGKLWIASNKGLFHSANKQSPLLYFKSSLSDSYSLPQDDIRRLLFSKKLPLLWIGTKTRGLSMLNLANYGFNSISPFLPINIPLNTTKILDLSSLQAPPNLDDATIWSIFKDQQQGLWIGSNKGLNYRAKNATSFTVINTLGVGDTAVHIEDASAIAETDGLMWIGTWGNGLIAYSPKNNTAIHYHLNASNPKHQLSSNTVRLLLYDPYRQCLWIGTHNSGLNRLDLKTGELSVLKPIEGDPLSLPHNAIRALYLAPDHRLWVGSGMGLSLFDDTNNAFTSLLSEPNNPKTLSDEDVRAIYQQDHNTLWVATGNGLNKVSIQPFEVVKRLGEKQGLSNSTLYSLLPDARGNLWISSNFGLNRFNPNTLEFERYFDYHNLQGNEYNFNARFKTKTLEPMLFFGGVNGVNYFKPSEVKGSIAPSQPLIIGIDAFDADLKKYHLKNTVSHSLKADEALQLDADLRRIQFDMSTIEFVAPQSVSYRYRLAGLEEQWNNATANERRAVYTNLSHGSYVFELALSHKNQESSLLSVPVEIKPYFWETLLFKLFVGLLLGLALVYFWLYRERIIKRQAIESERLQHYRKVVHELKTPLIHVKSLLGCFKALDDSEHKLLSDSQRNINRSLSFLDQLHSVVKLNSTLVEKTYDFLLEELIDEALIPFLDEPANKTRIRILPYDTARTVNTFEGAIYLILSNLVSNALKYSVLESPITIIISIEDNNLMIECIDIGEPLTQQVEDALYLPYTRFVASNIEGLGLGLSIIKQVVSLHNGSITLNHDYTKGNHFIVRLRGLVVKQKDDDAT